MRRASAKMGVGSAEVVVMGFSLGGMIARVGEGGDDDYVVFSASSLDSNSKSESSSYP